MNEKAVNLNQSAAVQGILKRSKLINQKQQRTLQDQWVISQWQVFNNIKLFLDDKRRDSKVNRDTTNKEIGKMINYGTNYTEHRNHEYNNPKYE